MGSERMGESMASKEENQKKWAQLVARAWMDESFKRELLNDPRGVCEASGLKFDKELTLRIIESNKNELCFVLPEKPEGDLSESELRNIAAAGSPTCMGPGCK